MYKHVINLQHFIANVIRYDPLSGMLISKKTALTEVHREHIIMQYHIIHQYGKF